MSIENFKFPETKPLDDIGHKLLEAAQIIRERGWCQHRQMDSEGRVCLHGAVQLAMVGETGGTMPRPVYARVRRVLIGMGVNPELVDWGAAQWNNAPERTADEVISALEQAAWSQP